MTTTHEVLADSVAGPPALPGVRPESGPVTRRVRVRLGRAQATAHTATPLALKLTEVVESLGSGWSVREGPANDQSQWAGWSADNPGVSGPQNREHTGDLSG